MGRQPSPPPKPDSLGNARRTRIVRIKLRHFHVLGETHLLQQPNSVVVHVEFPPRQSVPYRDWMRMVIVVPSFATGQQRNPPVITGLIAGRKAPRSPHVGGRV